jgi:hypothetical protein
MNRFGLTFHHLGLAVPSTAEAVQFLDRLGYRQGPAVFDPLQKVNLSMCWHDTMPDVELVWPGDEPILFGGRPVSFHSIAGFGLIELIHEGGTAPGAS